MLSFLIGAPNLAKHLKEVLEKDNLLNRSINNSKITFIDSNNSKEKEIRFYNFLKED